MKMHLKESLYKNIQAYKNHGENLKTITIISVFNIEPQYNRIGSKQYTDLDSPEFRK